MFMKKTVFHKMKKLTVIISILILTTVPIHHSQALESDTMWTKRYGGSNPDTFADLIKTNDGGYIAVGSTQSRDGDISVNKGTTDFWIVKFDSSGNKEWSKSYGGSNIEVL